MGKLDDLLIAGDAPPPGTIYRAQAQIVRSRGRAACSSPPRTGQPFCVRSKGLAPGALLLVQVTGIAEPGKAIPVTDRVLFKSRYAIVTPEAPGMNISRSIKDEDERDRLLEFAHEVMGDST